MIAGDHLAYILNKPIDQVVKSGALLAEGVLKAHELYKTELAIIFADIAVEAEAAGAGLEYYSDKNPNIVKHLQPADLKEIDFVNSGRLPELFKAAEICRENLGCDFPIFFSMKDPFSLTALTLGTEFILTNLIDNPSLVAELIHISLGIQTLLLEQICKAGYIPFIGAPISSGSLIGAKWFAGFAQEPLRVLFDKAAEFGSLRCLHICGDISPLNEQLKELNPDILSFEEWSPSMWNELADTIPMGYISTDLFSYRVKFSVESDQKMVKNASIDCLKNLPKPGVVSTGCDLPGTSDPEMVQFVRKCIFEN